MPTFKQSIHNVKAATKPHVGPLVGGKLAKRSRVVAAMRAQDKPVALGRRVVAAQSLAGESDWLVPDTAPSTTVRTHPLADEARAVLRGLCLLTPGHTLHGSVLYIGSGQTQRPIDDPSIDWLPGGKSGTVRANITWTAEDATVAASERSANLLPVGDPDGAQPANPWTTIRLAKIADIKPPGYDANTNRWSQHTGASITLSHVGGVRCIDAVLYEAPASIARADDAAADQAVSHLMGSPTPDAAGPTITYPVEELATDDPRGGTLHTMAVPQAQRERLGPHLLTWTAYTESSATADATEPTPRTGTSAGFRRLWDEASIGYDADEMGLSFSAGAYARDYDEVHPYYGGSVGTIPVCVAVYGGGEGTGDTGTVRVQASAWSWVDVEISDVVGWHYGSGHLRVGKGPGDPSIVQVFLRRDTGTGVVGVSGISIFHAGSNPPNL